MDKPINLQLETLEAIEAPMMSDTEIVVVLIGGTILTVAALTAGAVILT